MRRRQEYQMSPSGPQQGLGGREDDDGDDSAAANFFLLAF